MNPSINVTTTKICEKKVGEKQPRCNEIIHFSSDEFKDGKPKTLETLNKITELVNRELPPHSLLPAEKNIGMGTSNNNNDILAAPAIGFVDGSVPGRRVPGHSLDNNELKDILKPIRPPLIKSPPQTVQKTVKNTAQECKSNCSCKKKEAEESDNNFDITDDDKNINEQLEPDAESESADSESDAVSESDGDDDDDDDDLFTSR